MICVLRRTNNGGYVMELFLGNFTTHFCGFTDQAGQGRLHLPLPSSFGDLLVDFLMTTQKDLQSVVSESFFFPHLCGFRSKLKSDQMSARKGAAGGRNHTNRHHPYEVIC